MKLTQREKDQRAKLRAERKIRDIAWALLESLKALPADSSPALVPPLFAAVGKTIDERYSAFLMLDEQPRYFSDYTAMSWHSTLRGCRNHPVHGPELFDAINHRGAFAPPAKVRKAKRTECFTSLPCIGTRGGRA